MPVIRHRDPDAFLAAASPVMARSEATAAALIDRAGAIKSGANASAPGDTAIYLATYAHDGAFGVALCYSGGPMLVEESDPEAAAAFAADAAAEYPELPGVVGALAACESFASVWRQRTGRAHAMRFHLRHHVLTEVAPVPPASGAVRLAVDGDRDWLVDAQLAFLAEAGLPDAAERVRAAVPGRLARGRYWIWDDGGPVAFAGWAEAGDNQARIAPVYTRPGSRRRGYATALVAALARGLQDRGRRKLFLVTDLANPTSNAVYARIGFRPANDLYHFDFTAPG